MKLKNLLNIGNRIVYLLAGINIIFVCIMFVAGYSDHLNPNSFPLLSVAGLTLPIFIFSGIAFMLFWLLIKPKFTIISIVGLLLCYSPIRSYFPINIKHETTEKTIKVLSYNVMMFALCDNYYDKNNEILQYMLQSDADIICLQEFHLPLDVSMDSWIRQHFPGYKAEYYVLTGANGHFGNVTLSRRPVSGKGKIDFEKSTNLALWTDVRLDSATVRLYNCHFESYNISLSNLVKKDGVVEETERKMRRSITERPKQVAEVLRGVDNAPVRSIVLGDFNDNPLSYTYMRLLRGRHDSFVKAGKGFGATYRTLWPLLRIDYILAPKDLNAVSYTVPHVKYSDHYPIIATYYESRRGE